MKKFILLSLFIGCVVIAYAQVEQLSYRQALTYALKNNVTLQQTVNQLMVNNALRTESILRYAPTISATGQAWISSGNTFLQQTGDVINTQSSNLFGQVQANLLLFNGFSNFNTMRQARLAREAQETLIRRTEQDIINTVTNNYLQVLLDQELVKIAGENQDNQQAIYDQIKGFVDVGQRAIVELYTQDAELKRLQSEVLRAQRNLRNDKAVLALNMGVDPLKEFELADPTLDVNTVNLAEFNLDELVKIAMDNRADLESLNQSAMAAKRTIAISRTQSLPRVSAFGGLSSRYANIQDRDDRPIGDQFLTDNVNKQVGIQINIPIFSGWNNRTPVVRSRVAYENAELDVLFRELQIKSEVYNIYRSFQDFLNAYQASLAQREAAELAVQVQRESYELGIASQVELNQAMQLFVQAETTLASNKYRLIFQRILIDYATGTLSLESMP